MKTTIKMLCCAAVAALMLTACGKKSTPLAELAEPYIEMTEIGRDLSERGTEINRKPLAERVEAMKALQEEALKLAPQMEKLTLKAKLAAEKMKGSEMPASASASTGMKVNSCVIKNVSASVGMAQITFSAAVSSGVGEKLYFLLVDKDNVVAYRGSVAQHVDSLVFSAKMSVLEGAEKLQRMAQVTEAVFVTADEYKSVKAGDVFTSRGAAAASETVGDGAGAGGADTEDADAALLDGSGIKAGMPLAETIRKAGKVVWNYNADNGLDCNFGKVTLLIPFDDITDEGNVRLDAIVSDMADNIDFSADYIKPGAKISDIQID